LTDCNATNFGNSRSLFLEEAIKGRNYQASKKKQCVSLVYLTLTNIACSAGDTLVFLGTADDIC